MEIRANIVLRTVWLDWLCICRLRCRRLMKRNTRTIFAGGLLAVGTFAFAAAGQLQDGEAAYFKHDYANATRLLRPLADSGNAPAQNRGGVAGCCAGGPVVSQGGRPRERLGAGSPWSDV